MNILKSILLSSALITTSFGAAHSSDDDGSQQIAELSIHDNGPPGKNSLTCCHSAPANVWYMMCAMLSGSPEAQDVAYAMSRDPKLCSNPEALIVFRDMEVLKQKLPLIIASLLCSNTPVHEVLQNNDFHNLQYLMSKIGIEVDVDSDNGSDQTTYRKGVAYTLAAWAGKSIITAADIGAKKKINDGDIVVLSYDDMLKHQKALKRKDIHLCVDVHADANGVLVFDKTKLPVGLKKLYFQNTFQDVRSIGDSFLARCRELTHVDLSGLTGVLNIGRWFLVQCERLIDIDLSGFTNVENIDASFLNSCVGLTSVDLAAFTKVSNIKSGFLYGCSRLTHVDLSAFAKVTMIGDWFLSRCENLRFVNLPKISKVKMMGNNCLRECTSLICADLSGFENLTNIGPYFLLDCTGLTEIKVRDDQKGLVKSVIHECLINKILVVE